MLGLLKMTLSEYFWRWTYVDGHAKTPEDRIRQRRRPLATGARKEERKNTWNDRKLYDKKLNSWRCCDNSWRLLYVEIRNKSSCIYNMPKINAKNSESRFYRKVFYAFLKMLCQKSFLEYEILRKNFTKFFNMSLYRNHSEICRWKYVVQAHEQHVISKIAV
jgi:hypothetical protein